MRLAILVAMTALGLSAQDLGAMKDAGKALAKGTLDKIAK